MKAWARQTQTLVNLNTNFITSTETASQMLFYELNNVRSPRFSRFQSRSCSSLRAPGTACRESSEFGEGCEIGIELLNESFMQLKNRPGRHLKRALVCLQLSALYAFIMHAIRKISAFAKERLHNWETVTTAISNYHGALLNDLALQFGWI